MYVCVCDTHIQLPPGMMMHMYTYTRIYFSFFLSLSLSLTHTHTTQICVFTHAHTRAHTHTHTHRCCMMSLRGKRDRLTPLFLYINLSLTHPLTHPLSLPHTHTHTHNTNMRIPRRCCWMSRRGRKDRLTPLCPRLLLLIA